MSLMLLNGRLVPPEQAVIPVLDRSVLFADSIYEVVAVYEGRLFRLDLHWERLTAGAREIGLRVPFDQEELGRQLEELVAASDTPIGGVYLQLTRGAAPRSHTVPETSQPFWFGFAIAPHPPEDGATAITHPDNRWGMCYVKTTALLANSLAREAAKKAGCREAILVRDGLVTEASSSNAFAVFAGELFTHPLANILPGITRHIVIDIARSDGIRVNEVAVPINRFREADEVFITGTMSKVIPILALDGKAIANGKPGPVTTRLVGLYRDTILRTIGLA